MSGCIEVAECSFCEQEKPVSRTYIKPSKWVKPESLEERSKLVNEGNYFIIVWHCSDCGEPKFR